MTELRRGFERIPVETVTGTLHTPGDLEILDLSRTGLAFATAERLEQGSDYDVELRHRGQPVQVGINVRWVRKAEAAGKEPTRYRVGAAFVSVLSKSDTGIWDFIGATDDR